MPDVFHANRIEMASTLSRVEGDQGDVLLLFQCVGPGKEGEGSETMLGQVVIGLTYAYAYELSQMLQQQIDQPIDPRYRGPRVARSS